MADLIAIDGDRHSDVYPVPESVTAADGQPVGSRDPLAAYPLAAECGTCAQRIELPDRGVLTDWQHVDGAPPPRHPPIPPPRGVR